MSDRILTLKNISAIKEAQIHLNGLCLIAGENDTGKSTIAKVLMAMIKTHNIAFRKNKKSAKHAFNDFIKLLFEGEISKNAFISICEEERECYQVKIENNVCVDFKSDGQDWYRDATYLQGSFVWDFLGLFGNIETLNQYAKFYSDGVDLKYPYLAYDLYQKMYLPALDKEDDEDENLKDIKKEIIAIMNGFFMQNNKKQYKFYRNNQEIPLNNVSMGIKELGILQTLLEKNRITPQRFLIFDEPENHLHPKWQLVFAEILVQLSALKIPIIINSHSPNFIEAIYKYGIKYQTPTHFHLADDGVIKKYDESNERTLELIFDKLSEVIENLEELDFERLEKANNWQSNG